jgi:predicted RNase H-like HicB family nuclease
MVINMILNTVIEKDEFGYFAQIPELKGCVTQGKTYQETLFNIKEAAELYLVNDKNLSDFNISICLIFNII